MSWDRLSLVTPPAEPVVTTAEAKAQTRIDVSDDNLWLENTLAAAEAFIDGPRGIGLAMVTQTWRLSLDCWPQEIRLPLSPVQSITSITYTDLAGATQTLAADQYTYDTDADPVLIRRAFGAYWPATLPKPGTIKVTFVAGFGGAIDVPMDLKHAILMLVSHFYDNRNAVIGIGGKDSPVDVPHGTKAILERYGAGRIS